MIVGNPDSFHIGGHLLDGASDLAVDIDAKVMNVEEADGGPKLLRHLVWKLGDHRRIGMWHFSKMVREACASSKPDIMLVTGIAPLTVGTIQHIRQTGIICANWLTDDPWNPKHKSSWFLKALSEYDVVFTPRRANQEQIMRLGPMAHYVPFAYSPKHHFQETAPTEQQAALACDVLFYGGADDDRVPFIEALQKAGLNVHLYGGYWKRWPTTRAAARGHATLQHLRWAVSSAKITLCLVRRANRDGHVMRTFEAPAMGACMLAEDTNEHREIFGDDGVAVAYFTDPDDLVKRARYLLETPEKRTELSCNAHALITQSHNTYTDRLKQMLELVKRRGV